MCKPFVTIYFIQSLDDNSLRALEGLMNEFFASSTTNQRKREIGEYKRQGYVDVLAVLDFLYFIYIHIVINFISFVVFNLLVRINVYDKQSLSLL